jgi:cAMP-dependent protein kinase regulator
MNPKKAVKDLEKQLRKDPNNLVLRIRLASAFQAAGEVFPAVDLYRSVAMAYYQQNRIDQAIAVCHSLLEIAPDHHDTRMLLLELDARRAQVAPVVTPQAATTPERAHSAMTPTPATPSNTSASFKRSSAFDTTGGFPRKTPTGKMTELSADPRQRARRPSGFEADPFTPGSEPDMFTGARQRGAPATGGAAPVGGARRGRGETRPLGSRTAGFNTGSTPPSNKRFPLPLMRTQSSPPTQPPPTTGQPSRPRPESMPPTAEGRPRGAPARDVDEDAATRIAWPGERGESTMGDGGTGELPTIPPRNAPTSRAAPSRPPPSRGAPPPTRPPPPQPTLRGVPARTSQPRPSQPPPQPTQRGIPSRPPPPRPGPPPSRARGPSDSPVVPDGRPTLTRISTPPPSRAPARASSDPTDTEPYTRDRPTAVRRAPAPGAPPTIQTPSDGYTIPRGGPGRHTDPSTEEEPTVYDDNLDLQRAFGLPTAGASGLDPAHAPARFALLSSLPDAAVEVISAALIRRRVGSGEVVLREGDAGDSCYLIGHGEVRVLKRDPLNPRGDLMEVSRLGEGELFGEVAMLSDRRRHATVQAVTDSEVLEIPRAVLRDVAERFPEVDVFLQKFYRDRIISTLVETAPFFRPLEPAQRNALIAHFQFSRAETGEHIIVEGERSGGFFLIVLGVVDITKRVSERRQVLLATLGEGSYFGEMSLLRGDVARASVTATGPTELAVLPAKNFYSLVASHPILWDQVRHEAHRRELEMVQIVTGVTGSV